jgi:hypothetical protein
LLPSGGSALTLRGGTVVGTDERSLSLVHQVPSNGEEHEKESDDDPNIDAGHLGMKLALRAELAHSVRKILPGKGVLIGTGRGNIPF